MKLTTTNINSNHSFGYVSARGTRVGASNSKSFDIYAGNKEVGICYKNYTWSVTPDHFELLEIFGEKGKAIEKELWNLDGTHRNANKLKAAIKRIVC